MRPTTAEQGAALIVAGAIAVKLIAMRNGVNARHIARDPRRASLIATLTPAGVCD
jgi:hypothetical protein